MGRKKTLDRDKLLGIVATIVASGGVGALTIDGVAKAAGISKGGVQSVYGSKEQMIKALFEHCQKKVDERLMPIAESADVGGDWVSTYLNVIAQVEESTGIMTAGVLAAMAKTPVFREDLHKRYANRLRDIQVSGGKESDMRLVFLAAHGAFFLRYFGFMNIASEQWDQMFSDIRALAQSTPPEPQKTAKTTPALAADTAPAPKKRASRKRQTPNA